MPEEQQRSETTEVGGIWFLHDGTLTNLAPSDTGSATVLVPSEHVLMLTADLPLPSRRQRLSALPFAIEDQIAEPLGDVHVALGEELSPRRHLAGVVRHSIMMAWVDKVMDAGLTHCAIVPDCLSLPVPEPGSWFTQVCGDRVLVRTPEGTGFATTLAQLPVVWTAAGSPVCISQGEPLPPDITWVPGEADPEPLTTRLVVPALDLRQGMYAKPRRSFPISARKLVAVLSAGVLIHAAIAIVDTFALQMRADKQRAEAQALAQQYLPGVPVDGDFAAEVSELVAAGGGPPRSRFVPLLVRASAGLGRAGTPITLQSLSFDERSGELSLQIDGPNMVALERAQGALASTGLNAVSGTASVRRDGAGNTIVVRDPSEGVAP